MSRVRTPTPTYNIQYSYQAHANQILGYFFSYQPKG